MYHLTKQELTAIITSSSSEANEYKILQSVDARWSWKSFLMSRSAWQQTDQLGNFKCSVRYP